MVMTDRAFRALAHAEPDVIMATLRVLCPDAVTEDFSTTVEDLSPTRLDSLAPPRDVDWVALAPPDGVLHLECQGYRDAGFDDRVFEYHLWLVLRYPKRRVETVALWLVKPPTLQASRHIVRGNVTVRVTPVVLSEVPAAALLDDARTACFAAGAAAGTWSDKELCDRVVAVLKATSAGWYRWHMAVVAAATRKRYKEMVQAMNDANVEPVIIEDLIKIGEDLGEARGEARGEVRGLARGRAESVLVILEDRKLTVEAALRDRIVRCTDVATLDRWLVLATRVNAAAEIEAP